jgi:hypothetical protein
MSNEITTFDLGKPAQAIEVAAILQRFVKEKKLTANIKGKDYPMVEAWAFAGSQLGLYPVLQFVQDLSDANQIKYLAEVNVFRYSDNMMVGKGIAVCSNKEANKRQWDEYAICSMAQTRATGKAFRNLLSWIMKAAGFEATPAEEMDFNAKPSEENYPTDGERDILRKLVWSTDMNDEERERAFEAIDMCPNYDYYQKLQFRLEERQLPLDQVQNPTQKEISKHIKKLSK